MLAALLVLFSGKGDDAGRPSAVRSDYGWEIAALCDSGAITVRAPIYPGRLAVFVDQGCGTRWLDIDGHRIVANQVGDFVFAVPLEWEQGPRAIGACTDDGCAEALVDVAPVKYPRSNISVDKKFINPPASEKARIERDREHIAQASGIADLIAPRLWSDDFLLPRPPDFTSVFGAERVIADRNKNNGEEKRTRHLGLDFDGDTGDPITAAQGGLVVLAEPLFYSGNTVFLAHGDGLVTTYFHMTEILVKAGQTVLAGQELGTVGKTGRVTGPHLHFSAKLNGVYFDPWELFEGDTALR